MVEKIKLIIHIGIPKTASTTLQNGLFSDLHSEGLINYLGTAALRYSELQDGEKIKSSYLQVMKVAEGKTLQSLHHLLSNEKLNVFSEEMLANPFIVQKFRGVNIDPLNNPKLFAQAFNPEEIDIKILINLRNQQSMIPSYYAETYRYYAHNRNLNTLSSFLNYIQKNPDLFYSWHFDKLIKSWEEYFGIGNIKISFYEDFIDNPENFSHELSDLLHIDQTHILKLIYKNHFNKKEKSNEGTYRELRNINLINKMINTIMKITLFKVILRYTRIKLASTKIYSLYRKIRYKKVLINKPTEQEKNIIFNYFKEGNLSLATRYKISNEFLDQYRYI